MVVVVDVEPVVRFNILNMRKHILLFVILSIGFFTKAYTQILYTKQDSLNNNFYSISEEIGKDNFLVNNVTQKIVPNGNFYTNSKILKISRTGILLDSINIDTNFIAYGPLLATNNAYYIYGVKYVGTNINTVITYPTLIKYDINFHVIAITYFNAYSGSGVDLHQKTIIKNNNIYLFFGTQHTSIKCYKLNTNLTKLDSAIFSGYDLLGVTNYSKNIIVCGNGLSYPSSMGRLQVHELDTTFNLVSHFNIDSVTHITAGATSSPGSGCSATIGIEPMRGNLLEISNNKYLVSGYFPVEYNASCQNDKQNITSLIKNNSQIIKTNILGKQNGIHEASAYFAYTAKKYNYLYTVSKSGANLQNPFSPQNVLTEIMVTKLDTNGNVVWNNFYNTPDYYYDPYSICGTSDSGVAVCGVRYNISNPAINGVCEGFVMKIDKNGNQVSTGIHDKEIVNSNTFNLFPNPTINEAYVQFPNLENELEINIKVLDMLGKTVYQTNQKLNNDSATVEIDTKQLTNGVYYVTVSSYKGSVTKKLSIINNTVQ